MTYIIYNKSNKATVTSIAHWYNKYGWDIEIGCPYNFFNAKTKAKRPLKLNLKQARWYLKMNPSNLYRIRPL